MCVFECLCYVHNQNRQGDKFASRSTKSLFLGYTYGKKGWRVYDLQTGKITVSRDVIFCEDQFPYASLSSSSPALSPSQPTILPDMFDPDESFESPMSTELPSTRVGTDLSQEEVLLNMSAPETDRSINPEIDRSTTTGNDNTCPTDRSEALIDRSSTPSEDNVSRIDPSAEEIDRSPILVTTVSLPTPVQSIRFLLLVVVVVRVNLQQN